MNSYLVQKNYKCPICDIDFQSSRVRSSKIKVMYTDTDLRPYYYGVDPVLYEVVSCPKCGYSSLNKTFFEVDENSKNYIKKVLQDIYTPVEYDEEYDYDTAVKRFKLAIKLSDAKKIKAGELSYLYLKLSWLFRVMEGEDNIKFEYLCLKRALELGEHAYKNETMPIVDIEESVFIYLLGEIARRVGEYDKSYKYISQLIISKDINARLKQRAQEVKELIKADKIRSEQDNT